jgi:hypothetical protein
MSGLRGWIIFAWIALPTVMYGGYSLIRLLSRNVLTPAQVNFFRAGHAHAGVLTLMSLLLFPERASLGTRVTLTGAVILVCAVGVLVYGLISMP